MFEISVLSIPTVSWTVGFPAGEAVSPTMCGLYGSAMIPGGGLVMVSEILLADRQEESMTLKGWAFSQ